MLRLRNMGSGESPLDELANRKPRLEDFCASLRVWTLCKKLSDFDTAPSETETLVFRDSTRYAQQKMIDMSSCTTAGLFTDVLRGLSQWSSLSLARDNLLLSKLIVILFRDCTT
jgi:hypothetical protein